jgi:GNAT superfamily N-acetyltransferase
MAVLSGQLGYPTTPEDVRRRLNRIRRDRRHAVYVADLAGRKAVGWVHVCARKLVQVDLLAEVEALVVDEGYHRRGVGRCLIQRAEQWAREQGCHAVCVRSNVAREQAHVFYERVGYDRVKTSLTFRKVL